MWLNTQFLFEFCLQLGQLHPSGSPCTTDECTLCLFSTFLATYTIRLWRSLCLGSARRVKQGLLDPLQNCLRLQRVIRGIKRSQGSLSSNRLPITNSHMLLIWKSLNVHLPDHCMFWAACTLEYFGFLRAGEFKLPNLASFSTLTHLTVQDITVDGASSPSCMRVTIEESKTNPFRKGLTCILVWAAIRSVQCKLWWLISLCGGMLQVLFSCCKTVVLYLVCSSQVGFGRSPLLAYLETFAATVSA